MLFNGGFAAPAADAAGTDEFGILVNCAVRRFGHDRVFSRIKNPCQATLHSSTTSTSLAPVREVLPMLRHRGFFPPAAPMQRGHTSLVFMWLWHLGMMELIASTI